MNLRLLRLWLLVWVVSLAGCSTPTLRPQASSTTTPAFWSGRLALNIDSTPPQNLSATFELLGSDKEGQLLLLSPLGTSLGRLRWQPGFAQLDQGEHHWQDSSVQALTERLTGTPLPLDALFQWLQGNAQSAAGWQADLEQLVSQRRLRAERQNPAPAAQLKLQLDR